MLSNCSNGKALCQYIIVGGPHPTIFKQDIFKQCPDIDLGVVGEGEETILDSD